MSLAVKLKHALGEKTLALGERPPERPWIVGRGATAAIKVPSITLASEHVRLFVAEGKWTLQDVSGGATLLNGAAMNGPAALRIGDAITLGSDSTPVTLEIEPDRATAGEKGQPAPVAGGVGKPVAAARLLATVAKPPGGPAAVRPPASAASTKLGPDPVPSASAGAPAPAPAPPVVGAVKLPPATRPIAAPTGLRSTRAPVAAAATSANAAPPQPFSSASPQAPSWGAASATDDDPFANWPPPEISGASATPRRPAARRSNMIGTIVGLAVCAAIVVVAIWQLRKRMATPPVQVIVLPPKVMASTPASGHGGSSGDDPDKSVFDQGINDGHRGVKTDAPPIPPTVPDDADANRAAAAPVPAPVGTVPTPDVPIDEEFADIQALEFSSTYALSILKYQEYRETHPHKYPKELARLTNDALDRLWWSRIKQLCDKRDSLNKQIKAKQVEITQEPKEDFRKTLTDEKKLLDDALAQTMKQLTVDLGYKSDGVPDLNNEDILTHLRGERDNAIFIKWKAEIQRFIHLNHGATPWDGDS